MDKKRKADKTNNVNKTNKTNEINEINETDINGIRIDRDFLEKINNLDDETLRNTVKSIAEAAGVSKRQAEHATANINRVKKRIRSMTEDDIKKAVEAAGEEKAAEIIDMIRSTERKPPDD